MKELLERLKAPLNAFWKKMLYRLLAISSLAFALSELVQPHLNSEYLPEEAKEVMRYIYVAGLFGSMLVTLTKKDPSDDQPVQ